MSIANPDIYCVAQIIPRFTTGGGPSGASDVANGQGQLAYEVGGQSFNGYDADLSAFAGDWHGWDYEVGVSKTVNEETTILAGQTDRWQMRWVFNKHAGGHLWGLEVTDVTSGTIENEDLVVHTDGYGRGGQSSTFFGLTGESSSIQSNPTMGGSSPGSERPGTDHEWASEGAQQGATKGARWAHGSPCVGFQIKEADGDRRDIHILTVPLDFAPWGQENQTRATGGCPLICDVWSSLVYENKLRLNWPRKGIHTGFDRLYGRPGGARVGPVSMRKSVLSMDCVDGFDEVYVYDGADGAKTATLLNGTTMHAAFDSTSFTGAHLNQGVPGDEANTTWIYFFADLTNWPAGYDDVGAQFRVNLSALSLTAAGTAGGYPAIGAQSNRTGFVSEKLEGVYAIVRVSVAVSTAAADAGPSPTNLAYTGGTLTVQAIAAWTETNDQESFEVSPGAAQKTQLFPYSQALSIPKNYITDTLKRGGLIIKSTGANARGRQHPGLGADFCIGMVGQFPSGALGPLDPVDELYSECKYYWFTKAGGASLADGPNSRSYSSLTWSAVAQPDGGEVDRAFSPQWNFDGRPHINIYLRWPIYWMCGTFAEVKAHMDWLYDNGWLAVPLPPEKYDSVA